MVAISSNAPIAFRPSGETAGCILANVSMKLLVSVRRLLANGETVNGQVANHQLLDLAMSNSEFSNREGTHGDSSHRDCADRRRTHRDCKQRKTGRGWNQCLLWIPHHAEILSCELPNKDFCAR